MVKLDTGVTTYETKSSTGKIHVHVNAVDESCSTIISKAQHVWRWFSKFKKDE